ncbi:MAG: DUF4832 domain-containing protein [Acidobacteriaceae bacterium]
MRALKPYLLLFCAGYFCAAAAGTLYGQQPQTVVVKPKPIDGVLANPDIGFTTFQRFNGDSLNAGVKWTEGFPIDSQPFRGMLENKDYPATTIAYLRIYWRFIEPQEGVYRWDIIDNALQTARQRGQTLMLRIAPYGVDAASDVPAWYRSITHEVLVAEPSKDNKATWKRPLAANGPSWESYDPHWMVDPMNPAYAHYFGGMVRALGERYDGDPDLNLVDVSIVGPWGEGAGTSLLTKQVREGLMDSYLDSFHETPLVVQPADPQTDRYALAKANVGWRADCLGDMGGFKKTWNHMTDYYPEAIIEDGLSDAWKKAPVTMEACWVMQTWQDKGWDIRYIMDQAIKWHVSSFNAKSSAVPKDLWPEVNRWLQRMGYRIALRRFSYPAVIGPNRRLAFASWWENEGDAPCYREFPLALRLSSSKTSVVLATKADIRTWMPGDSLYNESVFIPADLPDGNYELSIAIVDPTTRQPKVKLASEGLEPDGWYRLGEVKVQQALTATSSR